MSELKPCPFCGEPPSCNEVHMGGPRPTDTYRCKTCRVSKTAVEWNTRAEPDLTPDTEAAYWYRKYQVMQVNGMKGQQALEFTRLYVDQYDRACSFDQTLNLDVLYQKAKALLEKYK